MTTFFYTLQIISAIFTVILVLLHSPKGDGIASIGAASQLFSSQKSFKISQLESMVKDGSIETAITPVYELLDWGRAVIKDSAVKQIKHGISPDHSAYINLPIEHTGDNFFIMDNKSNLIAVAERIENSSFPLKLKIVINK